MGQTSLSKLSQLTWTPDATLAIVGAGFLAVIPMALWSAQFRHSGAVPILVLWIILMFAGMICNMAFLHRVDRSFLGPLLQYRFCTPGYNDTLPFSGNPITPTNSNWNDTIWTLFTNSTIKPPSCIYPCLASTDFLRQAGDLHVVKFINFTISPGWTSYGMLTAVLLVGFPGTIGVSIVILVLKLRTHNSTSWYVQDKACHFLTRLPFLYVKVFIPIMFVWLLISVEWIISMDLQSEEMQLVGQ